MKHQATKQMLFLTYLLWYQFIKLASGSAAPDSEELGLKTIISDVGAQITAKYIEYYNQLAAVEIIIIDPSL